MSIKSCFTFFVIFSFLHFQGCYGSPQGVIKDTSRATRDFTESPSEKSTILSPITELHSSFSDDLRGASSQLDIDPSILSKVEVAAEINESVEEIILTIAGSANENDYEKNNTDEKYIVHAQPRESVRPIVEEVVIETVPENETVDSTLSSIRATPEDIPSFSEWSQQQLAERRRADTNVTERVRTSKVRSRNYASPDCGAKIVAANPEAVSASSVLTASRDEYMLSHCAARIWFIVELCEAVQAKQLDLANFELFSNSPREFSVYLGSRFPSRDWSLVGRFTAQDSRDIQAFTLSPYLFGKFLKIEVHSHYGKEHYCPLSWVKVYGTSEYEVLATEDERHSDDDDDVTEEETGTAPRNLFSSATDAVLSIVKKATAPFMKSQEKSDVGRASISLCVSPRYITVCNNCSQHTFDNVFYLLSCQHSAIFQLVTTPYVRWTLIQTDVCKKYGLDFVSLRKGAPFPAKAPQTQSYLTALLKEPYLAALCNVLAVLENRVVVNMSLSSPLRNLTDDSSPASQPPPISLLPASSTCEAPDYSTSTHNKPIRDFSSQIKPTKTLREEELVHKPPIADPVITSNTDATTMTTATAGSNNNNNNNNNNNLSPSSASSNGKENFVSTENIPSKVSFLDKSEEITDLKDGKEQDTSLDAILRDLSEFEGGNQQPSSTPPPGPPKDSLFLRLANRIKNLELNMSLSSSYLEELSRRYRLQVEALGQTVNATAMRLEEQIRLEELRTRKREEEILMLRAQLNNATRHLASLLSERNSWLPRPIHIFWFLIELLVVWYLMNKWFQQEPLRNAQQRKLQANQVRGPRRRNSIGSLTEHVPIERSIQRRPSDEALEITLAINYSAEDRKRKKKRKEANRKTSASNIKRKRLEAVSAEPVLRQSSEPPPSSAVEVPIKGPEVVTFNRFAAFTSPDTPVQPPVLVRRFSSPGFMRTAMSSRAARSTENSVSNETMSKVKKESGLKKYMRKLF